jgi:hypothetical protein
VQVPQVVVPPGAPQTTLAFKVEQSKIPEFFGQKGKDNIIRGLGTRLDFGTEQIAIFLGELYFMLPFTLQVKHLIPFPGIEHIKIQ